MKEFLCTILQCNSEKKDSKEFVFDKEGKTKYHLTGDCEFIKKDYLDFNIPDEIRELGDDAVGNTVSGFVIITMPNSTNKAFWIKRK